MYLPALPSLIFTGPGYTSASLSVADSALSRTILLDDWHVSVRSGVSDTQMKAVNHTLYLAMLLHGGTNAVLINYTQTNSLVANDTQFANACSNQTSATKLLISNTADQITQCLAVQNGIISVNDTVAWDNINISASALTVQERYKFTLLSGGLNGLVLQPFISALTTLNIACGECNSNECSGATWWNFGVFNSQQLSWKSSLCGGSLVADTYPIIRFTQPGMSIVKANLTSAAYTYNNANINTQFVNISATTESRSLLSLSTDGQHELFVIGILSQTSSLQLDLPTGNYTTPEVNQTYVDECSIYSSSATVLVSTNGPYNINTVPFCMAVVGSELLHVIESTPWTSVLVNGDTLTVPARYQLRMLSHANAVIWANVSASSRMEVMCGYPATTTPTWNVQTFTLAATPSPANLTSTSSACRMVLAGVILPSMLYYGVGNTSLVLQLHTTNIDRDFNFSTGEFIAIADNTKATITLLTDTVHALQVTINATNGLNSLFLSYPSSLANSLTAPAILFECTNAAQNGANISAVAISSASDNSSYCFVVASGAIIVSDNETVSHAIIRGDTWLLPQQYRVDLIEWAEVYIDPPVTADSVIEVQCGASSNLPSTPNWHMGNNNLSNMTWQGTACQGIITNLFPTYNFTGGGATNIYAKLASSASPYEVTRRITTSPNSLRVEISTAANISIYSAQPIFVSLDMDGGSNTLMTTYPLSSNSVLAPSGSGCTPKPKTDAAIFFSNMLDNNTYCILANNGFIFVEDTLEWTETYIRSSTLTVPYRYNVELLQWKAVYFLAFSNYSVVQVNCNDQDFANPLTWRIGRNTTAASSGDVEGAIVWNGASCSGVTSDIFPQLIFTGNGTTNVSLLLDQSFSPSNVTLQTLAVHTSYPNAFIASDGMQVVALNLTIVSDDTNLILDREPSHVFVPKAQVLSSTNIESLRISPITLHGELEFIVATATMSTVVSFEVRFLFFFFFLW